MIFLVNFPFRIVTTLIFPKKLYFFIKVPLVLAQDLLLK